jgi:hypothetical protein
MEIRELICADFTVRRGHNALRPGIAAVSARLEDGRLRVLEGACPHLLAEAGLYRYSPEPEDRGSEAPVDEHNHALAALRYLISRLDERRMARLPKGGGQGGPPPEPPPKRPPPKPSWLDPRNEHLWTRFFLEKEGPDDISNDP